MATKKNNPNVQKRVAERKAFVASKPELSKEVARKRFYVQTRAQELKAAGKTVDRAALRKNFEMGNVKREGFLTPQDVQRAAARRSAETSKNSATIGKTPTTQRPIDTPRTIAAVSKPEMMAMRRKPIANFKQGTVQKSSTKGYTGPNAGAVNAIDKVTGAIGGMFGRKGAIAKVNRAAGDYLASTGESLQATFVNPAINLAAKPFGKKPNLRQAGALESALNVADVAITASSFGTGAGVTAPLRGMIERRLGSSRIVRGVIKGAEALKAETELWRPNRIVQSALPNKSTTLARTVLKPGEVGGVRLTSPKPVRNVAKKAAAKPVTKKAAAKTVKAPVKKAPAKKAAAQTVKAPTKKAAARPVLNVSSTPSVEGEIKSIFSGMTDAIKGAGKDISRGTTGKAARENAARLAEKKVATKAVAKKAPVKKAVAKKSAPKASAPAKAPATQAPKSTTGPSTTSRVPAKVEGVPTFKSQADYDKFMNTGGKFKLQQSSREVQQQFLQQNRKFVAGRGAAKASQTAKRVRSAARQAQVVKRRNEMMLARMKRKGLSFTE